MSKVILICGMPGTGKTTLAEGLSKKLGTFCLHKDSIKERLYELMNMSTLEDSKTVGNYSIELLLYLATEQIANGVDIIVESTFNYDKDYVMFQNWIDEYNADLRTIICSAPYEERIRRKLNRPRHPAHHDAERSGGEKPLGTGMEVYDKIPGKKRSQSLRADHQNFWSRRWRRLSNLSSCK